MNRFNRESTAIHFATASPQVNSAICILISLPLVFPNAVKAADDQISFVALRPMPGHLSTVASDVSDDGLTVVGFSSGLNGRQAFRWTRNGGMTAIHSSAVNTDAKAVSADGSVIVGEIYAGSYHRAFRWTVQSNVMVDLETLPGGGWSSAADVSADGSVVVGVSGVQGSYHAFRWSAEAGMVDLGTLPGHTYSSASGTNQDGSVVVGYCIASNPYAMRAFRWSPNDGMVELPGSPDFRGMWAEDLSGDGSQIIGGAYPNGAEYRACLWTENNGIAHLGTLPSHSLAWAGSSPADLTSDPFVIVGVSLAFASACGDDAACPPADPRAVVWVDEHIIDLNSYLPTIGINLQGWTLLAATGVSVDGRVIAGNGIHEGSGRAWVTEAPVPAANVGDITADGLVNLNDLLAVISTWGQCPTNCWLLSNCAADVAPAPAGDCVVNIQDLLLVIRDWE